MLRNYSVSLFIVICLFLLATEVIAQQSQGRPGITVDKSEPANQAQQTQNQQPMMQAQPQQRPKLEVSEAEVEQVAQAYLEINKIQQDLQKSLSTVKDAEEAQKIQAKAGQLMGMAVAKAGIDVQRYNQIMQTAQFDETLRQRIFAKLPNPGN